VLSRLCSGLFASSSAKYRELREQLLGPNDTNSVISDEGGEEVGLPVWMNEPVISPHIESLYSHIDHLRALGDNTLSGKAQRWLWSSAFCCCSSYQLELNRAALLESTMADLRRATEPVEALRILVRDMRDSQLTAPLDRDKAVGGKSQTVGLLGKLSQEIQRVYPQAAADVTAQPVQSLSK